MMHNKPPLPPPRGMIGPRAVHLSKLIRRAFNEACNEQGLFSGQQDVVMNIVNEEGLTVGELAKKLNISAATVSVSVKRMEKTGFITKKPDEKDARIARLYPTEKAKQAPEIIKQKMDSLEEIITAGMTVEEIEKMSDLLDSAAKNLMKRGDTDV